MLHTLRFFSSKCLLFHNATFFGSCVIHILYTECAKIKKKKFRRQRVNYPTPWSRVLLAKLTGSQTVAHFSAFNGTRRFATAFTKARHKSLFWATSIKSIVFLPTSLRSILIICSQLWTGLPSGLFPSTFPPKSCIYLSIPHTFYIASPPHYSWSEHQNNIWWGVQITSRKWHGF